MYGAGLVPVSRVLKDIGITDITIVPEQEYPNGYFTTCSYPNPEIFEALELGLKLAEETEADLMLATDPDADRVGIAMKCPDGSYELVSGNEMGVLLLDYICAGRIEKGTMPEKPVAVKSIVSTPLADAVAEHYGVELRSVLTGFKWIGKQVLKNEQEGKGTYLFGMEESYGCLIGTYARDKDAISATAALCEAAAYYKEKGMTLWDAMVEMYEKYGYYKDEVKSIGLKGIEGLAKIQEIMENFRKNPPKALGGYEVTSIRDYKKNTITDVATGEVKETGLPESNVLYYDMNDGAWLCIRPSGTEPKIKFYYLLSAPNAEVNCARYKETVQGMV